MTRRYPLLRKWVFIFSCVVVILLAGMGMALGALLGYISTMPDIDMLNDYTPPGITRVFDRTGNTQIAQYFAEKREVIHLNDIPPHVVHAFIAIEDERFYNHFGVDLEAIGRAILADLQSGEKAQGASTITMQVARNVVLGQRQKAWARKFKELVTAMQIEQHYSKDQILEFYLNQIFFGASAYGIQAAAKAYFDKDVKDLSVPEAALLAGLPKAPSELSPFRNQERAMDRRNAVLGNMRRLGYIASDEQLKRYKQTPIELHPPKEPKRLASYYADYVRSLLMKDNSMEESSELGQRAYTIISAVDLRLQRICEEELSKGLRQVEAMTEKIKEGRLGDEAIVAPKQPLLMRIRQVKNDSVVVEGHGLHGEIPLPKVLPYFNPEQVIKPGGLIDILIDEIHNGKVKGTLYDKHVQGAAVLLDARTGEILALVGGDDFDDTANDGQWNRAVQGGRQPGSCWKPLLYASSFDITDPSTGLPRFTPSSTEMDAPLTVGSWSPRNYENNFEGEMPLYEALVESRNVPTVRLFYDIGPKEAVQHYHKFNIVNMPSNWDLPAVGPMALGTANITPLELTGAYSVFANAGSAYRPTSIKHMSSAYDKTNVQFAKPELVKVLSPQAAYMTMHIMQDIVRVGTAKETVGKWQAAQLAAGRQLPEIAGKTGTTNDCVVAWFVGYTPELVLGIYIGYDHQRSLGPKMTGSRVVGPVWVATMDRILQTRNDWKMTFDVPSGLMFRDICSKSGKLATASCYASGDKVFLGTAYKLGTAPTTTCDYHGGGQYATGAEYAQQMAAGSQPEAQTPVTAPAAKAKPSQPVRHH